MLEQAKKDLQSGKPILVYHNDENESALVVAAENMNAENFQFLRKYATGDIAVMLSEEIASKLGLPLLSTALQAYSQIDPHTENAVKPSHAGPTFDLRNGKTGSADEDKINAIRRFADLVLNREFNLFDEKFIIPGHVRTYIARKGLLDERLGHTELGVFLSKYSGMSAVVCMITLRDLNDGHPLNKEESEKFAQENGYSVAYEDEIIEVFKTWKGEKDSSIQYSANEYLRNYKKLKLIRAFEEQIEKLFREEKIRGSYHLSVGQEATGVALGNTITKEDAVFVSHRGHHIALGIGVDPKQFFAECIGDNRGLNAGRAGPMHFSSKEDGLWLANGIVAANAGISAGVALSKKIDGSDSIVINVIGEGSIDEGVSHETLTLASIWNLPMLILCENNLYSQTTKQENHLPTKDLSLKISQAYGIQAEKVAFGTDLNHLTERLKSVVDYIRKEKKPVFVEVMTYRTSGHSMSDTNQGYKIIEIDEEWKKKDPIELYEKYLIDNNIVHQEDLDTVRKEVESNINSITSDLL